MIPAELRETMNVRSIAAADFAALAEAGQRLLLFAGVLVDEPGGLMLSLVDSLGAGDVSSARRSHARLFAILAESAELVDGHHGDAWQSHLLDRILADENPFSRKCRACGVAEAGPSLVEAATADLRTLRDFYELSAERVSASLGAELPRWDGFNPPRQRRFGEDEAGLRDRLDRSRDWSDLVGELGSFYERNGAGPLSRERAFRWVGGESPIEAIASPDPIRLTDLIGYDVERELVIRNTEHFVSGLPANNVLLYGDRGTGKSSTVKALLNEYGDRGLRLIELPKNRLDELSRVLALLRGRRERFILFVDDLSFEHNESHYKDLKAILEGGLETRPANVLLYATSNRRHIVAERFSDRGGPLDEIHASDTAQEKLSLSDRFGIAVTFAAPDQARYLRIVSGLAAARGLDVAPDDLRRRALEWVAWQNARSGRTARQFIDFLQGELIARRT